MYLNGVMNAEIITNITLLNKHCVSNVLFLMIVVKDKTKQNFIGTTKLVK